jgi:hypothetical protein
MFRDLRIIWMPGGRILKRRGLVRLAGESRVNRDRSTDSLFAKASVVIWSSLQSIKDQIRNSNIRHCRP